MRQSRKKSPLRAVLFALYELQREVDIDEAIGHFRDLVPGYLSRREDLMALASAIALKRVVRRRQKRRRRAFCGVNMVFPNPWTTRANFGGYSINDRWIRRAGSWWQNALVGTPAHTQDAGH